LTLIPLVKYVFIVLWAGDRGNGEWASWSFAISKALVTTASRAVLVSQFKCPPLLPKVLQTSLEAKKKKRKTHLSWSLYFFSVQNIGEPHGKKLDLRAKLVCVKKFSY
jgi:hypothetical protein